MAYTNKTANYELPQYTPTDQPTYLEDFNGAMFTIDSGMKTNSNNIGDLSTLTTTAKSDLVSAVNEVNQNSGASLIGDLSNLTTTEKSTVVGAINEVDYNTDTNTTSIGTLSSLTTTVKTDLVSAINEVDGNTDTNSTSIGDLTSLTTTAKTDLVSAINEVASSSGGSCNVHYLNAGDYNSRTNALNFDTLENGIYIFYKNSVYTYDNYDVYFKRSADSQAATTSFVSLKNGAMLVKCKNWSDSAGQYDILGYISYIYFTSYSTNTNINQVLARFVKYSNGNLVIQKNDMTLITNDNKTSIATGYDSSKTQTLKNVNGTLTWVDDV